MQAKFFLSKDGQQIGPFTLDEVRHRLESQEQTWMDYIYDDTKEDWILLIEHPIFSEKFNQTFIGQEKSSTISTKTGTAPGVPKDKAWYTLKDGSNFGPFSFFEIIQMLQEKNLFEYDYVWHKSLPSWKRVAEVEAFKPEKMRDLLESNHEAIAEVFFRRRHLRAQVGCSLIVHNNHNVFRGRSLEISAGGAGILLESDAFQPGEKLFLHLQPGEGVPPFNAVCIIVSKQFVHGALSEGETVKYGVKFTSVSQVIREQIKTFAEKRKAG